MAAEMSDASSLTSVDDAELELNPLLDRAQLAAAFNQSGRVQIPNVLTDRSAQRLFQALERETTWGLFFNEGKERRAFETVSAEDHQQMAIAAWERAHSDFQFFYHYCRLSFDRKTYPSPDHYLYKLVQFLMSAHFLAFIREVTGSDSISWMSSDATLYKPLDFLTSHTDSFAGSQRLIAYSLNMTPEWRPDWGGALLFFDRNDHIEEGYLPAFNTLNLFRVPKLHAVSQVSVFGGLRYSISGWFHGEPDDNSAVET